MIIVFLGMLSLLSTFEGEPPWLFVTYISFAMALIGLKTLTDKFNALIRVDAKPKPLVEIFQDIRRKPLMIALIDVWVLILGLHALTGAPWFVFMSDSSFFNPYFVVIGILTGLTGILFMMFPDHENPDKKLT